MVFGSSWSKLLMDWCPHRFPPIWATQTTLEKHFMSVFAFFLNYEGCFVPVPSQVVSNFFFWSLVLFITRSIPEDFLLFRNRVVCQRWLGVVVGWKVIRLRYLRHYSSEKPTNVQYLKNVTWKMIHFILKWFLFWGHANFFGGVELVVVVFGLVYVLRKLHYQLLI